MISRPEGRTFILASTGQDWQYLPAFSERPITGMRAQDDFITMLDLVNVSCQRGERRVFSGLNRGMKPGTLVAVTGSNGSGKTSLLRILCGLLQPEQGRVLWKGQPITALKELYLSDLLYIGHLNALKDDLTAVENLRMAARLSGEESSDEAARDALSAIGLGRHTHELPIRVLSQGQKRRVTLARAWLSTRPLWILDEPFASLDTASTRLLAERFQTHVNGGGLIIVATHDEVPIARHQLDQMRLTG
jgi:heme exporter protein A